MKSKLLLSVLFTAAVMSSAFANQVHSAIHLRMFDGRPIKVTLNNQQLSPVASQHDVFNLTPGVHRLRVFAVQQHPFGWQQNMPQIFRGNIEVFSGYATFAFIDRFNQLVIERYEALYIPPVVPVQQVSFTSILNGQPPCNHLHGQPCNSCGLNIFPNNNNPMYSNPVNSIYPMHPDDFHQLLRVIQTKSFDSVRKQIALGALSNNYFTSSQIRQLLGVFTFESTKVEVAKQAYNSVVDPERYYLVYDAFTFSSSINQLQAYVGR